MDRYGYTFEYVDENGARAVKKAKRRGKTLGTVAAVLALALVCGLSGFGGAALYGRMNPTEDAAPAFDTVNSAEKMAALTGGELSAEDLYEAVLPSCVGITVSTTVNIFGQTTTSAASGSGFVLTADGYIATNYHVIEEAAENRGVDIEVAFASGEKYTAALVGGDQENDVAVIKIDAAGLTPVTLGSSGSLKVGEAVYTIGNPLGELTYSLTDGIVSALDRVISTEENVSMNMLQTNCAINPGNSGGPLFDSTGRVVGIVSAKYTNASSTVSAEGLGFAIPIDDVKNMLSDIMEYGYVTGKPILGVSVTNVSSAMLRYGIPAGAAVEAVNEGSCAEKAGITQGDIITEFDGAPIESRDALVSAVSAKRAGDRVTLTVYRQGETLELTVTLDEKDTSLDAQTSDGQTGNDGGYGYGWPFGNGYGYGYGNGRDAGESL